MANEELQSSDFKAQMYLDDKGVEYINITAKWAFFLSIIVFISIVLMLIAVVLSTSAITTAFADSPFQKLNSPHLYIIGFYILLALFYFIPAWHLFKFSKNARKATEIQNDEMLVQALGDMKSAFKTIGIFTIIILVIYAIAISVVFATVLLN